MQDSLILIVDDLSDWRRLLKGILSELNYRCDVASSSQEAIDMLSKQAYKLAIVDIRLDDSDENNQGGIDIVNWLAGTQSNTKAIMMTGYASIEFMKKAFLSGIVVDFVPKQEVEKLIESLTRVMQSQ